MELYHGSPIQGLKEIKPNESTQKGNCVYAAVHPMYSAVFAAINAMNTPITPKVLGWKQLEESNFSSGLTVVEREAGSLDRIKGKKISIYVLDGSEFNPPREHDEKYERTASGPQKVLREIVIDDIYTFLKNNNVNLVEYKDREKYGIPANDDHLLKGILKTYLWKRQTWDENEIIRANEQIEMISNYRNDFKDKINILKLIVDNLTKEENEIFLDSIWDENNNCLNQKIIIDYYDYVNNMTEHSRRAK